MTPTALLCVPLLTAAQLTDDDDDTAPQQTACLRGTNVRRQKEEPDDFGFTAIAVYDLLALKHAQIVGRRPMRKALVEVVQAPWRMRRQDHREVCFPRPCSRGHPHLRCNCLSRPVPPA